MTRPPTLLASVTPAIEATRRVPTSGVASLTEAKPCGPLLRPTTSASLMSLNCSRSIPLSTSVPSVPTSSRTVQVPSPLLITV
ncbi:hypothetical protein D9M69_672930 [compost metagenome]